VNSVVVVVVVVVIVVPMLLWFLSLSYLLDDEAVGDDGDVSLGDALGEPDGGLSGVVSDDVEHPRLGLVGDGHGLPGLPLHREGVPLPDGPVEAVLDREVSHELDGAAGGLAPLHGDAGQL
jgi:hypothetical protein